MDRTRTDERVHGRPPQVVGVEARVLLAEIREQMFGRREAARVGRFELRELLGRGAHGSVYLGDDTKLRRRVAVKLLRAESDARARDRLLREALALAQLKHPNVLTVHDVGVEDERVFIAMEHVEAGTLAHWCEKHPPGTRARFLALYQLALGTTRGLAAAHDAGIVHRDVKPANILVGADERPRIADFGVARALAGADDTREVSPERAESTALTNSGELVGTPAYMAPEQLEGRGDAASDQWSLCATFWEAAYGERPFGGDSIASLVVATLEPPRSPPAARTEVPRWWRDILMRGLSPDPAARWPSCSALASALASGPRQQLRRRAFVVAAATTLAGLAVVGGMELDRERLRRRCREEATSIAEVWNDDARQRLSDGLLDTDIVHAVPFFDAFAAEWSATYGDQCVAAEVERSRAPALWQGSRACLDDRRGELETLLGVLGEDPDASATRQAVTAAAKLSTPTACADDRVAVRHHAAVDDIAATGDLRRRMWRASALDLAGRYDEGLALARELYEATHEHSDLRLRVEACLLGGRLGEGAGAFEEARERFSEAFDAALAANEDDLAFDAATNLVAIVGSQLAQHEQGLVWHRVARGLEASLGGEPNDTGAKLRNNLGNVYALQARYDEAEREYDEALALRIELQGPDHPAVAEIHDNLGTVYGDQRRYADSERAHSRALTIWQDALGPDHPDVANAHQHLGTAYWRQDRWEDAEREYRRALAVLETALGPEHPHVGLSLANLGSLYGSMGRNDDAAKALERAVAIAEASLGPAHPDVAGMHVNLSRVYTAQGRHDDAERSLATGIPGLEASLGKEHPSVANARQNLGNAFKAQRRHAEAEREYREALAIYERNEGTDGPNVARVLGRLAQVVFDQGRQDEAIAIGERTLAIRTKASKSELDIDVAAARNILANLLWDIDAKRARPLAEQARDAYRAGGPPQEEALAGVEALLARERLRP